MGTPLDRLLIPMTENNDDTKYLEALVAAAEKTLSQTFGGTVRLESGEALREKYRNRVLRCRVTEAPSLGVPESVIVKASVGEAENAYDPDKDVPNGTAWRFYNEWAGNRFLNECLAQTPLNARLLGGDRAAGLFLLEDLGTGASLADVLLGDDPEAAETALTSYAASLGRLHAATVGREDEWRRIRNSIGGAEKTREPEGTRWLRENVGRFREQAQALGVPVAAGFDEEAAVIGRTLDEPGPFLSFSPGDTCPDNHRLVPGDYLRFFDFEFAGFRHALLDAAYLRVPFPTCWCVNRVPPGLVPRLEAAYRAELIAGCPEAADDSLFYTALCHACASWTVTSLSWGLKPALEKDDQWGIATQRQRHLLRLETFTDLADRSGCLAVMRETARMLSEALRALWPEPEMRMPIYPPFRPKE